MNYKTAYTFHAKTAKEQRRKEYIAYLLFHIVVNIEMKVARMKKPFCLRRNGFKII